MTEHVAIQIKIQAKQPRYSGNFPGHGASIAEGSLPHWGGMFDAGSCYGKRCTGPRVMRKVSIGKSIWTTPWGPSP